MSPSKKTLMGIFTGVLLLGAGYGIYRATSDKREIVYQEVEVTKGNIKNTILSTGVVQPENRLEVKSPIAGRVEKILVDEGQEVKRGQILAWMSSTERAALIDTAKSKGKEELAYWENAYKPTPLMAPISGQIILRNVEPGQTITVSDALLVMSDRLCVKAQVDETDIAQVKNNQKVQITLDAYPEQEMEGTVVHIAYESKTVNNVTTYIVDIVPSKVPEFMKSGMTANVVFTTQEKEGVLLLPASAVQKENGKYRVLIAQAAGAKTPDPLSIEVGVNDGKKVEVLGGLQEGDKVLVPKISLKKLESGSSPLSPFGSKPKGMGAGKRIH